MPSPPLVFVKDVSFSYAKRAPKAETAGETVGDDERKWVLHKLNVSINEGEFVCVLGPSGCGKSTLIQLVAGFLEPGAGTIYVDGVPNPGPGTDRALVPQQTTLYPWFNVIENVALPLQVQGIGVAERLRQAQAALDMVGLGKVATARPANISGGMQQRVMVARALVQKARLLLMDEPFGALDAFTREQVHAEMLRVWHDTGVTVLLITHDVEEAVLLATRVCVMGTEPGRIMGETQLPFGRQIAAGDVSVSAVRTKQEFVTVCQSVRQQITGR